MPNRKYNFKVGDIHQVYTIKGMRMKHGEQYDLECNLCGATYTRTRKQMTDGATREIHSCPACRKKGSKKSVPQESKLTHGQRTWLSRSW